MVTLAVLVPVVLNGTNKIHFIGQCGTVVFAVRPVGCANIPYLQRCPAARQIWNIFGTAPERGLIIKCGDLNAILPLT